MNRGLSVFVRDNLEAFAVAIALALVVRHYSLEAFRIPSKSMMPTLVGSDRAGDRILVDKYRWIFGEPHRWEPTVFQYPLNRSRNFIKRLVGLPGEWMRIRDGDIWTSRDERRSWEIARKTEAARESLFFPFYPSPVEKRDFFANRDSWERGPGWEADERKGRFKVDAAGTSALRFRSQVVPYDDGGIWGDLAIAKEEGRGRAGAGDLRVRFDLLVERAGTIAVVLTEQGVAHRLVLGPKGSEAVIDRVGGAERFPLDFALVPGEYSISFANVDDTLVVEVEGDAELAKEFRFVPVEAPDPGKMRDDADGLEIDGKHEEAVRMREEAAAIENALEEGRYRVWFEAEGLKATLEGIRIDRDVQYTQDGEWQIPEGHYFMLGDNTGSSKDSRAWQIAEAHMKDGTVIRWEEGSHQQRGDVPGQPDADFDIHGPDRVIEVKADVDGLVRRFRTGDVDHVVRNVPYGFVSRDHLVGRAFAIFWPIYVWPVAKDPTRVGLIR